MKPLLSLLGLFLFASSIYGQVGINNVSPNASLDISASDATDPANTDGILIPRIDQFPTSDPGAAQNGMLIYLTTADGGNLPGFYFWNNGATSWEAVGDGAGQINELSDGIYDGSSLFLGSGAGANDDGGNNNVGIGDQSLSTVTSGTNNAAVGFASLQANTSGRRNTAIGYSSLATNTTGGSNTSIGQESMFSNTTGAVNVAIGNRALYYHDEGAWNIGIGGNSMFNIAGTSSYNISIGGNALIGASIGVTTSRNIAIGYESARSIATGADNIAIGYQALRAISSGSYNLGIGNGALQNNTSATYNTAIGYTALNANTTGGSNVAVGARAMFENTVGSFNTGVGFDALYNINGTALSNTALGYRALSGNSSGLTGSRNTAVGTQSLDIATSAADNVAIGYRSLDTNTSGNANVGVGNNTLGTVTTGINNTAVGHESGNRITTTGANTYFGYHSGRNSTAGSNNTYLGALSGRDANGSSNIFIGYAAGLNESGSNKLYIDNNATSSPLVWGDFATNDFRINGTLQVSNPIGSGYEFPAVDGTANQVLQTNGSGTISWGSIDSQFTDGGSYLYPADGTTENLLLGTTTGSDYKLGINALSADIQLGPNTNADLLDMTSGNQSGDGIDINLTSTYTLSSRAGIAANLTYGNVATQVSRFETGSNNLYGIQTSIGSDFGGTEYGIYSSVLTANGHAGYFLGDLTVGTTTSNTYTLPASRGTNGQLMQTDGSGNASWVNVSSAVSPTNGLSAISSGVGLGGTLTQTTSVDHSIYDLTHDLTSSGDFAVAASGTRFFEATAGGLVNVGGDTYWRNGSTTATVTGRYYDSSGAGILDLYNSSVRTRINSNGDSFFNGGEVGIGMTSPNNQLDVTDNTTTYVGDFYNTNTGVSSDGISVRLAASLPTTGAYYVGFFRNVGVTVAGRVAGTSSGIGVQYVTTSDARLKTNFQEVDDALGMISEINPLWYEFKSNRGYQEMGFLAQELNAIYPYAVSGEEDSDPETNPMMVDYGRITPLLTAGIQELEEKVTNLEENVAQLQAENDALKASLAQYQALEARIAALEGNTSDKNNQASISAEK
ncbi:tail fiber domain-containing protein [Gilvibacter sp.]|uniref:tail fiber domain-containing protein n=1 Tax=Gilvibacter sp. TaxID=2729997 RepID=UPI003F4A63E0